MATWGVHIRIAEYFSSRNYGFDSINFLVGNVGADCGVANKDHSKFTPSTKISHWIDETNNINANEFLNKNLDKGNIDNKEWSFLVGYYIHLLTDIEWRNMVEKLKRTNKDYCKLKEDKKFIWTIKKDWYDLDHLYFRNNPNGMFWTTFQYIEDFPDYLDYYPQNAIINKVKSISNFYKKSAENIDREYKYLTLNDMELFIEKTVTIIENKLIENKLYKR